MSSADTYEIDLCPVCAIGELGVGIWNCGVGPEPIDGTWGKLMSVEVEVGKILQSTILDPPWSQPGGERLPGTRPIPADGWIIIDEAFAAQMRLRDRLISGIPQVVHALRPEAIGAARELLAMAIAILRNGSDYVVQDNEIVRPDGVVVAVDFSSPLLTLGRLVQEDFCLLQKVGAEHVMTGAVLCFPASWCLAEKLDRPLTGIHEPVRVYDSDLSIRVQRLFGAIRPGKPLMRSNCLSYSDPSLFQPRTESARRQQPGSTGKYARFERQCLVRLPETGDVAFSIHTTVVERRRLARSEQEVITDHFLRSALSKD